MKKIIVSFLVIALVINCCFLNTKAAFLGGDGSKENPYVISTAEELNEVRNNLNSYFVLNNDIDLSGFENFLPIGNNSSAFAGNFNGNGKKITGLTMNFSGHAFDVYVDKNQDNSSDDYQQGTDSGWTGDYEVNGNPESAPEETITKIPKYVGLFGVNNGKIYDLHIENANITVNSLNDEIFVGAFCGVNNGEIYRCYSTVSNLVSNAETDYCGGLIGLNNSNALVGNSFSKANVKANKYAGGLVGINKGNISCSFYNGFDVVALNSDAICNNNGTAQYNYYLESYLQSSVATKLSLAEFSYSAYFTGFNFTTVWKMNSGIKQPELRNNPYPVKQRGEVANQPEIESVNENIVTLKTDGKTLFSNDGVNWTLNNTFTQEIDTTVNYYAKKAETTTNYLGATSSALEYLNANTFDPYDVNLDGLINIADMILLRRYLAGWNITVTLGNLDINQDGKINNGDAIYFARYLAGWNI